jgi:hypothetical protein
MYSRVSWRCMPKVGSSLSTVMSSGRYPYVTSYGVKHYAFEGVASCVPISTFLYRSTSWWVLRSSPPYDMPQSYANEQCTAPPGLNRGLCSLCCSLDSGDDIVVGWKAFFDVGEAGTVACEPTQQVSYVACMGGKGGGQGGQSCTWRQG